MALKMVCACVHSAYIAFNAVCLSVCLLVGLLEKSWCIGKFFVKFRKLLDCGPDKSGLNFEGDLEHILDILIYCG